MKAPPSGEGNQGATDDTTRIQGSWKLVGIERDGQNLPLAAEKEGLLVISGDQFTLTTNGQVAEKGTFKLNPSANPKALDMTPQEGPDKGKTMLAIYELSGDSLRLCSVRGEGRRSAHKFHHGPGQQRQHQSVPATETLTGLLFDALVWQRNGPGVVRDFRPVAVFRAWPAQVRDAESIGLSWNQGPHTADRRASAPTPVHRNSRT